MESSALGTRTLWMEGVAPISRPPLQGDATADVCVIGAGIAGLLCAYQMVKRGLRVIVLDAGVVAGGETARTTAHLTCAIDDRFYVIEHKHGEQASRISAASHHAAIGLLEEIARGEGIDCEFDRVDGYLFLPPGEKPEVLDKELEAAHRAGLGTVERAGRAPSFESGPCLRFPQQGQFHPTKFLAGVVAAIERLGGVVHTGTRVAKVHGKHPIEVSTQGSGRVLAETVVVATNSPITGPVSIHAKQVSYRTYVSVLRVPPGSVARALYWDTSEEAGRPNAPYHYVRVASSPGAPGSDDLLIVGGGDHRTGERGDSEDPWGNLEAWARARWPVAQGVAHRWSGQVQEPHDHVAFIGRSPGGPDNLLIATGDSGMGMTHGAIASMIIPELAVAGSHEWRDLYAPTRKPTTALGELGKHAGKMVAHYADWLAPGAGVDSIRPGEGRVMRKGLNLLAAHRDERGVLHTRSAVCTHLGCIVHWNQHEKSWDCPCHGSRFASTGQILNAPAHAGLEESEDAGGEGAADRRPSQARGHAGERAGA